MHADTLYNFLWQWYHFYAQYFSRKNSSLTEHKMSINITELS
jgi:hypothetical protein